VPYEGVYIYFRYDDRQTILCAMNTNKTPFTIALDRLNERMGGYRSGKDVITKEVIPLRDSLVLQPLSNRILELMHQPL
ncbi:MAG TPA: cyclomaltodextrinase C-terminal domain-containing protein, partial [Niabella sp.]